MPRHAFRFHWMEKAAGTFISFKVGDYGWMFRPRNKKPGRGSAGVDLPLIPVLRGFTLPALKCYRIDFRRLSVHDADVRERGVGVSRV